METENNTMFEPVDKRELAAALALYPIAYVYTLIFSANDRLWFGVFVLLFVALVEYMNYRRPRAAESWVWLGCLLLMTACVSFGWGRVWDYELSMLFVHALAVWWTLSRSGALLEGGTGSLFPADVLSGLVTIPFGNFFLRLNCLRRCRGGDKKSALPVTAAVIAAALLLYWASLSLANADERFESMVSGFLGLFEGAKLGDFVLRFCLSLPVAAWLFGLIAGSRRRERAALDEKARGLRAAVLRLRTVPEPVWLICMGVFAAVYLLFFGIQGSYVFGAFTRTLPEGFIVSQYARRGFFELCRVMAINFALLWLVTRTGKRPVTESRTGKLMCTLLLAAGMLFAVVAISKLALYISCFGFTPKRLQSTWLAAVMMMGSASCVFSLWTGKRSFRFWTMFSAATLSLLHLF